MSLNEMHDLKTVMFTEDSTRIVERRPNQKILQWWLFAITGRMSLKHKCMNEQKILTQAAVYPFPAHKLNSFPTNSLHM